MDDENCDQITLEIEGNRIKCSKALLSKNSDYFRIMFESDFIERSQSLIKLHDIDLKSINLILKLLWDYTYNIDDEDILLVLHTACILQFDHVKYICIERITEKLNHENCLKVWLSTEQLDILPLYLKAKNLALTEFNLIQHMDCILELNLNQLQNYLSNVHLKCQNEMDVFLTGMKWYYEQESKMKVTNKLDVLLAILSCISYVSLREGDIREILAYPDICQEKYLVDVLNCLIKLRHSDDITCYGERIVHQAEEFNEKKKRYQPKLLCLFLNNHREGRQEEARVTIYKSDCHKRKRIYCVVGSTKKLPNQENSEDGATKRTKSIMCFDEPKGKMINFFRVPEEKCTNLIGYAILAYKELIFLFGGEMSIGRGKWNYNVWAYDTIRERWERKTKIPFGRRHFECCIANDSLFIIGGTGNFRVLQENMLYYSYKEDKWSKEIVLPCRSLQVKCCEYKNHLFLLSIIEKSAYLYNMSTSQWITYKIPKNALNGINGEKFSLFSYEDYIYIKASKLVQMDCLDTVLNIVSVRDLNFINCDKLQSVLCNNILYTFYKNLADDQEVTYTLEMFNLTNNECTFLFENKSAYDTIEMDGQYYLYSSITKLFPFQHHNLLVNDTPV